MTLFRAHTHPARPRQRAVSALAPDLRAVVERCLAGCEWTPGGCLVRPGLDHYGEVKWSAGRTTAHRAVLAVAEGYMPGRVICTKHSCDNPPCVNVEHLSFGTHASNVNEAYERARRQSGTWPRGEERPGAVLTDDLVRQLRLAARSGLSLTEIAAMYGVPYSPARGAIRGETWTHITDVPPVAGRKNSVGNPRAYRLTRPGDAKSALALMDQGYSLAEIGRRLNVSRATAWNLARAARQEVAS